MSMCALTESEKNFLASDFSLERFKAIISKKDASVLLRLVCFRNMNRRLRGILHVL